MGAELPTVQQHAHTTLQQLQKLRNYLEVPSQMLIKLKYGSHISTPAAPLRSCWCQSKVTQTVKVVKVFSSMKANMYQTSTTGLIDTLVMAAEYPCIVLVLTHIYGVKSCPQRLVSKVGGGGGGGGEGVFE